MSTTNHTGFGGLYGQRSPLAGHATVIEPTTDAAEAVHRAGLDWQVEKRPLWYTGRGNGSKPVKVDGHFATVRVNPDGETNLLGTVRGGYTPVQNAEAFAWAEGLGEFVFAGALREGGQTYLGVKLDRTTELAGDTVDMYLLLWNGHDGSKSLGGMVTPVRLRCLNQLSYAKSKAVGRWFARHTSNVGVRAQTNLSELMTLVDGHVLDLRRTADRLAATAVSNERAAELLGRALPGRTQLVEGVLNNLRTTTTLDDAQRNTGWGLMQATTEYFEWVREARTRESALQSTLDGVGARAARALETALVAA